MYKKLYHEKYFSLCSAFPQRQPILLSFFEYFFQTFYTDKWLAMSLLHLHGSALSTLLSIAFLANIFENIPYQMSRIFFFIIEVKTYSNMHKVH